MFEEEDVPGHRKRRRWVERKSVVSGAEEYEEYVDQVRPCVRSWTLLCRGDFWKRGDII